MQIGTKQAPGGAAGSEFEARAWPGSLGVNERPRDLPGNLLRARRGVRGLAAGVLLVLAGLFASVAPAQTTTTLVSNVDNSQTGVATVGNVNNGRDTIAYAFTTGGNADGYTLNKVVVVYGRTIGASVPRVSIYTSSSGNPGSSLYTLTNPSTITDISENAFTAPAGAELARNTTYFVVFEETVVAPLLWYTIDHGASTTETAAANGWSLANRLHFKNADSDPWSTGSNANLLMRIEGVIKGTTSTLPGAPRLTAAGKGLHQIDLSWSAPANGGAAITGYKIESTTDSTRYSTLVADTGSTSTSYSHTGLSAGDSILYRVSALNAVGQGRVSNRVRATTDQIFASPNELASNLRQRSGEVELPVGTDEVAQGFNTGASTSGYTLKSVDISVRDVPSAADASLVTVTLWKEDTSNDQRPGSQVATLTNPGNLSVGTKRFNDPAETVLEPSTNYFVKVEYSGTSPFAMAATSSTYEDFRPAARWSILDQRLERTRGSSGSWSTADPAKIRVNGDRIPTAPGPPTNLTASSAGTTRIALSWRAPLDDGTSAVRGYKIEVSTDSGENWSDLVPDTGSTATTYTHADLSVGDTRHYRVSAINSIGTGTASAVAGATAADPPGAPTGLTATAAGQYQIDLSWMAPSDNGGAAVIGYKIESSADGRSGWSTVRSNTGNAATGYSQTFLSAGATRYYRVAAINGAGTGPFSAVARGSAAGLSDNPDELVSNLRQTSSHVESVGTREYAQGFTTGGATGGYILRSVEFNLPFALNQANALLVTVTLWKEDATDDQVPGSSVATLTNPANLAGSNGTKTFLAPTGTALEADTNYFVKVVYSNPADMGLATTASSAEDAGAATGWSIFNKGLRRLQGSSGAWTSRSTALRIRVNGRLAVSDEIALSASPTSVAENAAATAVTVTGTLNGGALTSAASVTVSVGAGTDSATEGTDYATVNDLTLTISAGQTSGTATFTLTPADDTDVEGDEAISVTGTTAASGLSVTGTELTLTDDEVVSTEVVLSASPTSVTENAVATAVTVTGTLNGSARTSAASVTVSVGAGTDSATEGADYATVNDLTLTISAGQTSGTATFTLTPADDTVAEGDEAISVTGTTAASGLSVTGTELTLADDDAVSTEVALSVNPTSVAENAAATAVTVTGTLNAGTRTSAALVTVSVGSAGDEATEGADFAAVNDFTLTIDAGLTSGTATFTLTPANDTLGEGAEEVSVTGTTAASGLSVTGTELTITDDDAVSTQVALSARPAVGGGERRADGGHGDRDPGRGYAGGGHPGDGIGGWRRGRGHRGSGLRHGQRLHADHRCGPVFRDGDVHADAGRRHAGRGGRGVLGDRDGDGRGSRGERRGADDYGRRRGFDAGGAVGEPAVGGGERRADGRYGDRDPGRRGADGRHPGDGIGGWRRGCGRRGHGLRRGQRLHADHRCGPDFGDGDVHADAGRRSAG